MFLSVATRGAFIAGILNIEIRGKQNTNCFPRYQSLSDLLYSKKKKKRATATATAVRRSTFAGSSALLPSDVIDFAMSLAQRLLEGNSFIVRFM